MITTLTICLLFIHNDFRSLGSGNIGVPTVTVSHTEPDPFITKIFKVTAYCLCSKCCGKWSKYKTTASGHKIQVGDKFVAAPKEYKFGTMMLIPGYSNMPVPILDRGGTIKGNRLDVYFDKHEDAVKYGVKWVKVKIQKN